MKIEKPAEEVRTEPVVPQQPEKPVSATPQRPAMASSRPASMLGGISIKGIGAKPAPVQHIEVEVKPLSEEDLTAYWQEAGKELGLEELLAGAVPHLGEKQGCIEIDAQTVSFHEEFKPKKIEVMEFLRKKTGMRMLDCKVNQLFVSKDEVIYSPEDKYQAMLEQNPQLAELRKLFPIIDY